MHISDIYFRLLVVSFKLHTQVSNKLRCRLCEKTPNLRERENFEVLRRVS